MKIIKTEGERRFTVELTEMQMDILHSLVGSTPPAALGVAFGDPVQKAHDALWYGLVDAVGMPHGAKYPLTINKKQ